MWFLNLQNFLNNDSQILVVLKPGLKLVFNLATVTPNVCQLTPLTQTLELVSSKIIVVVVQTQLCRNRITLEHF